MTRTANGVARAGNPSVASPASCTFVAAVLEQDLLVVGSVGDSRAYWLPDAGTPTALTVDDSFAQEQIASGVPRAEAEAGPQSHAITRWLGEDAPDHTPTTTAMRVTEPGWLLVCSDGLWNYCSAAEDLAVLVQKLTTPDQESGGTEPAAAKPPALPDAEPAVAEPLALPDAESAVPAARPPALPDAPLAVPNAEPIALAEALVGWANARGGQDNITVALARLSNVPNTPRPTREETRDG